MRSAADPQELRCWNSPTESWSDSTASWGMLMDSGTAGFAYMRKRDSTATVARAAAIWSAGRPRF